MTLILSVELGDKAAKNHKFLMYKQLRLGRDKLGCKYTHYFGLLGLIPDYAISSLFQPLFGPERTIRHLDAIEEMADSFACDHY